MPHERPAIRWPPALRAQSTPFRSAKPQCAPNRGTCAAAIKNIVAIHAEHRGGSDILSFCAPTARQPSNQSRGRFWIKSAKIAVRLR